MLEQPSMFSVSASNTGECIEPIGGCLLVVNLLYKYHENCKTLLVYMVPKG